MPTSTSYGHEPCGCRPPPDPRRDPAQLQRRGRQRVVVDVLVDTAESLTFSDSGGCGDAYFWTTNEADDRAVTVGVELHDRSTTEPTVVDVTLPDARVEAHLLTGSGLASTMCSDLPQGEVTGTTPVTSGRVVLTIDPRGEVGRERGHEADRPRRRGRHPAARHQISTTLIGFYAG